MQSDILFDNVYIGHSVEDADKLKAETYDLKIVAEKAEKEASKPLEPEKPASPLDLKFMDDPLRYIQDKFEVFMLVAQKDPIEAIKAVPEIAGAFVALFGVVIAVLFAMFSIGNVEKAQAQARTAAQKAKDAAITTKDKVAEAAATGSEKVQSEVQKRTTRSSAAAEQ